MSPSDFIKEKGKERDQSKKTRKGDDMIELVLEDWLRYLVRNRKRVEELIYIKPGQRIIAARPPYQLPARRGKGLTIRVSIVELRRVLADS